MHSRATAQLLSLVPALQLGRAVCVLDEAARVATLPWQMAMTHRRVKSVMPGAHPEPGHTWAGGEEQPPTLEPLGRGLGASPARLTHCEEPL